jgi:hypothetical protein
MQNWINRTGAALACSFLLAVGAPSASADVIINTGGGVGTATFVDNVMPSFNPPFGVTPFETLIGEKSFTSRGDMTHSVTVPETGDRHFTFGAASGLRWVETVTNDTGFAWSSFSFALDGAIFYPDSPANVPSFVTLTGTGAGVTNVALLGPELPNGWTLTQDLTDTIISADFSSDPLGDGESFSVYIALLVPIGQEFQLTQSVPEPGSLALLAIGLAALGFGARRKRS